MSGHIVRPFFHPGSISGRWNDTVPHSLPTPPFKKKHNLYPPLHAISPLHKLHTVVHSYVLHVDGGYPSTVHVYEAHSSERIIVPGAVWALNIAKSVAASPVSGVYHLHVPKRLGIHHP